MLGDELDGLSGGCSAGWHQFQQVRLDEALVSARTCGGRELEVTADLLGNYADALAGGSRRMFVRELAAIGVGNWKAAADAAAAAGNDRDNFYMNDDHAARFETKARCRAAWYRAKAGESGTFKGIATSGKTLTRRASSTSRCIATPRGSSATPQTLTVSGNHHAALSGTR